METLKRNYQEIMTGLANGNLTPLAKKTKRSIAILRERNDLTDLEDTILRQVEKLCDSVD